jgi:REP element-mobilizing transposase RayT
MSRRTRSHQPGSTFHLTTRLHRSEALFLPELRTALVGIIRDQLNFSDMDLLAYAIMPNHIHLVVRQGQTPIHRFMQPIVRRAALLVQRSHGRQGHVFERRYRDHPCADPGHLRNAIVYTHLNPVRAGLCAQPGDYSWTSHAAWLGDVGACDGRKDPAAVQIGLQLFATGSERTRAELISDYRAYLAWRLDSDRYNANVENGTASSLPPQPNYLGHGDTHWMLHMTPRPSVARIPCLGPALPPSGVGGRADLSEIMRATLVDVEPGLDPGLVRSRWGGPAYVRARHALIRRASAAGYSGVQIAAYLRVSPRTVSAILASDRKRLLKRSA